MPPSVYRKHFGDTRAIKAQAAGDPLSFSTPMYAEVDAARQLQITHAEFKKLPRRERYIQFIYQIMKGEKDNHQLEKAKREANQPVKQEMFERYR